MSLLGDGDENLILDSQGRGSGERAVTLGETSRNRRMRAQVVRRNRSDLPKSSKTEGFSLR